MSKFELSDLKLSQLTEEQRLKITQGIVDDLIRALNLGNYSLVWRYLSDDFSAEMDSEQFNQLHEELATTFGGIESYEQQSSVVDETTLKEAWALTTKHSDKLQLQLELTPIKEFLTIERFTINKGGLD